MRQHNIWYVCVTFCMERYAGLQPAGIELFDTHESGTFEGKLGRLGPLL